MCTLNQQPEVSTSPVASIRSQEVLNNSHFKMFSAFITENELTFNIAEPVSTACYNGEFKASVVDSLLLFITSIMANDLT